jgi:hypothetical protein
MPPGASILEVRVDAELAMLESKALCSYHKFDEHRPLWMNAMHHPRFPLGHVSMGSLQGVHVVHVPPEGFSNEVLQRNTQVHTHASLAAYA